MSTDNSFVPDQPFSPDTTFDPSPGDPSSRPARPPGAHPQPPTTMSGMLREAVAQLKWDDVYHIGEMPCARKSLLLGIGGGAGIFAIRVTRSTPFWASQAAVGAFMIISGITYGDCAKRLWDEKTRMRTLVEKYPQRHVRVAKQRADAEKRRQLQEAASSGGGGDDTTGEQWK